MLDAIEERMKQDYKVTAATQLVKMLGERGFIALVPNKNLLHNPLRNWIRAQL